MLIGYASMVRLLAEAQLAGRLMIRPRFVFSASEVLTDSTRRLALAVWGRSPYNVYGATETSGIAAECGEHAGMHLFEDLVITEVVDADNRPVPPGEYGAKVLVTVLSRTVPLIRYEMSDSLQLGADHDCPCGRPYALITGIQGREQESLIFLDRQRSVSAVQPIVSSITSWTVFGQRVGRSTGAGLEVLLAQPHEVDTSGLAGDIRAALAAQGVLPPPVQVNQVIAIPRTALGKAPLITKTSS